MSAPPKKAPGRPRGAIVAHGPAGVPFFTIMLDVSANLLCVVVLLLTISAAAQSRRAQTAEVGFPIRAGEALAPAGLVEAFRLRTVRSEGVATIDLRRDHVDVKPAGASPLNTFRLPLDAADFASSLRGSLAPAPGKVLVFVFSQEGHAALRRSLDEFATSVTETDVPVALRAADPEGGWSGAFRALFGREIAPATFPERLARIISGGLGADGQATGPASRSDAAAGTQGLLWTALQAAWRLTLLMLCVCAVILVGRLRPLAR
ncbi:hypothetical protein [Aquibium sp. ELW1220]|uniref:hypothetical protein n=1 Tax=Aquibium sp. ELW1220 TaxID=2976766 RepID=UPI0025B2254C|nr:hypothetical protein [Aquibium sp. ELW1220]MDN2581405.1 hypothetical protein [Aquibium sp. ELW1220]